MKRLLSVACLAACLIGCSRESKAPGTGAVSDPAVPQPVLHITVGANGGINVEGKPTTLAALKESLPELKTKGGFVQLISADDSAASLSAKREIVQIVAAAGLSVALRTGPGEDPKSVEQLTSDVLQLLNGETAKPNEGELRAQAEADFAEIRRLGLADRAQQDFAARMPGAKVVSGRISYFRDTNTVWCSFSYLPAGKNETLEQGFGYRRESGTNWSLLWDARRKENADLLPQSWE